MSLEMCQEHAGLSSSGSQEGLISRPQSPVPIFESSTSNCMITCIYFCIASVIIIIQYSIVHIYIHAHNNT